jgi:Ice-binding-like/Bacterial Ig-like domain
MSPSRMSILSLLLAALAILGCRLPLGGLAGEGGSQSTTAPTIRSTAPEDAATEVAVGASVNVVFSEAMDPSTLTGATFTLTQGGAPVAGAVTYSGVKATFTPTATLALGALYKATITTGVDDLAQNALAANHTWSFTTRAVADTTLPAITSTSPADGAADVASKAVISATFSEAMEPSTVTGATFTVTRAGAPLSGSVTYAGTTATFTPESALPLDGSFLATVSTGVKDLAGNALAAKLIWTFTTPQRPTVLSTSPAASEQGVALNRPVQATFSEAMDPATILASTFFVKQGGAYVSGVVSYQGTTATFAPTGLYPVSSTMTATITTGAKDQAGNALVQSRVWSFETGTKATQGPVALGLASPFAVLASDMVTNTASVGTVVKGDLGISPGLVLMGFPPGVINGGTYLGVASAQAQVALLTAYNEAAGRPNGEDLPAAITGLTFTPGLYHQVSAVALSTGKCTLDAQGDAKAVFIFQIGTSLSLAADTEIVLSSGARAANVYWAVGTAASLGAGAKLKGTVMAATAAITVGAGATVEGRLLAHNAAVTLDTDLITVPAP